MALTKITEKVITPGSIDANSLAENISVGGVGQKVTVNQVIITDSNFANTADISIPTTGGYVKLYGNNFTSNSNVYLSTTFSPDTQVTANVVSNNEIQVTISTTDANTYNLFVFNEKGKFAFREDSVTSILLQATAGWFGGGYALGSPVPVSTVERIDFAADTATASVRGPLSSNRYFMGATSNNDYGWFGGGLLNPGPGAQSTVDRITFTSDTNTASVKGPLSIARQGLAATGNDDYGWFGGGNGNNYSRVDRIDFAADTGTASVRGPLSLAKYALAATGNDDYGWFGNGSNAISTVDRITFAADTGTASVRGPLSSARYQLAATGNNNYGWFGGGKVPASTSTVDRIDFAADTGTASVRGPLSLGRLALAASGNDDYGWFGGGAVFPLTSRVDRITFAADTAAASVKGTLSLARYRLSATSGIA